MQKLRDWKACHFDKLPDWMRDNEYLHFGHRPQLPEFAECFRSIFRIHSETGNIWTHLIGFVAFVIATIVFYVKPFCDNCHHDIQVRTHKYKYFAGIIIVNSRYVSMQLSKTLIFYIIFIITKYYYHGLFNNLPTYLL